MMEWEDLLSLKCLISMLCVVVPVAFAALSKLAYDDDESNEQDEAEKAFWAKFDEPAPPVQVPGEEQPFAKGEGAEPLQEKIAGSVGDFRSMVPADGVFTAEALAAWDGVTLPMCFGLCGSVYDVSSSENFVPGFGYGKLWAGKDGTYGLGRNRLVPDDANTFSWSLEEDFSDEERHVLASWHKHFSGRYPVVGTLKEYEGRDWSAITTASAQLPPSQL